jgi:hypothetical protein
MAAQGAPYAAATPAAVPVTAMHRERRAAIWYDAWAFGDRRAEGTLHGGWPINAEPQCRLTLNRSDLKEMNESNFARFDAKLDARFAHFEAHIERGFSAQARFILLCWATVFAAIIAGIFALK